MICTVTSVIWVRTLLLRNRREITGVLRKLFQVDFQRALCVAFARKVRWSPHTVDCKFLHQLVGELALDGICHQSANNRQELVGVARATSSKEESRIAWLATNEPVAVLRDFVLSI